MWKWIVVFCIAFSGSLSAEIKVLAFSGSTQENSLNKKLILNAANIARQMNAHVTVINLRDYPIPLYDRDLEIKDGMSMKAKQLRQLMINSQVILIASPEYNGSLSGVLKNALDWASRGENGSSSREAFKGKKFIIMSASPGSGGGMRGLVHLKAILEDVGGIVMPGQVIVPNANNAFDEKGRLKNTQLQQYLQNLIQGAIQGNGVNSSYLK